MDLLEQDAAILTLVPSLAPGLVSRRPYVDSLYTFLDTLNDARPELVSAIRLLVEKAVAAGQCKNVSTVHVDLEKTVLLTYAFGDLYSAALALADGGIEALVAGGEHHSAPEAVQKYMRGQTPPVPVFMRVDLAPRQTLEQQAAPAHGLLRARAMLEVLGLRLDLDTLEVHADSEIQTDARDDPPAAETGHGMHLGPQVPKGEHVPHVPKKLETCPEPLQTPTVLADLHAWFCLCEPFSRACAGHFRSGTQVAAQTLGLLARFFQRSRCNHATPLPVCMHLLALVLLAYNPALPVRVRRITRAREI